MASKQEKEAIQLNLQLFKMLTSSPLLQNLLQIGTQASAGQVPDFLRAPAQREIGSLFGQARQNLFEQLGSAGQLQSGLGAGPMAFLSDAEARALSEAFQNAQFKGLDIAGQIPGLFRGSMTDPRMFQGSEGSSFWKKLLGGLAGAAIPSLAGLFGKSGGVGSLPLDTRSDAGGQSLLGFQHPEFNPFLLGGLR